MSTKESTIEFILDQISGAGELRVRKMFGEYALYCDEKVVALVCDNLLFVKITEAGLAYAGEKFKEGTAYKGAKPSMLIDGDLVENRVWLRKLIRITADALPTPKPKKKKK